MMATMKGNNLSCYEKEELPIRNDTSVDSWRSQSTPILLELALQVVCLHGLEGHLDPVSIYMMSLVEVHRSGGGAFGGASSFLMAERMRKANISVVAPPTLRLPPITKVVPENMDYSGDAGINSTALPSAPSSSLILMDGHLYCRTAQDRGKCSTGSSRTCEVRLRHTSSNACDSYSRLLPLGDFYNTTMEKETSTMYSSPKERDDGLLYWEGYRYDVNQENTFTDSMPLCIYWHPSPQDGIVLEKEERGCSRKTNDDRSCRFYQRSTDGVAVLLGVICMNHLVEPYSHCAVDKQEGKIQREECGSSSECVSSHPLKNQMTRQKPHSLSTWCNGCPSCSSLREGTVYSFPGTPPQTELQCNLLPLVHEKNKQRSARTSDWRDVDEEDESFAAAQCSFTCRHIRRKCQITSLNLSFSTLLRVRASQLAGQMQRELSVRQYSKDTVSGCCPVYGSEDDLSLMSSCKELESQDRKQQEYLQAILHTLSEKEQSLLQRPSFESKLHQIVTDG